MLEAPEDEYLELRLNCGLIAPPGVSRKTGDSVSADLCCSDDLLDPEEARKKADPRLLMIVPWLSMGGADKFNLDLLQQLKRLGWEVWLATTLASDDCWFEAFYQHTPHIMLLHRFLKISDYAGFLLHLIRAESINCVYLSHSELGYRLLPHLRAHSTGVAFLDYCHIEEEGQGARGYPYLSLKHQDALDLTVVSSQHLKNWMLQRGGVADRVEVCYTNVDTRFWAPDQQLREKVRRQLGLSDDIPVILYAGRLCPQKQPEVFSRVVLRLAQSGYRFVSLVAGDGEERELLMRFICDQGLSEVVSFLGRNSSSEMKELMAASDIFFLPSRWEGIAVTLYEAMASGLAVVCADVGGQKELVIEDCGFVLPRGDRHKEVAQYVQAIAALLDNPSYRIAMGQRARERVSERFHLKLMGDRMVQLFETARALNAQGSAFPAKRDSKVKVTVGGTSYIWAYRIAGLLWPGRGSASGDKEVALYRKLRDNLEPIYRIGLKLDWRWLIAVKDLIKYRLGVV